MDRSETFVIIRILLRLFCLASGVVTATMPAPMIKDVAEANMQLWCQYSGQRPSIGPLTVILAKEGVAKSLKALNHEGHEGH